MIPADAISFQGDTAWLVDDRRFVPNAGSWWADLDRPCDTCEGFGYDLNWEDDNTPDCPTCHGSKRHTFDIEVECSVCADLSGLIPLPPEQHVIRRRASIVPGMVLPILQWTAIHRPEHDADHISLSRDGSHWTLFVNDKASRTTLPPAAKPGIWAVLLRVQT